MQEDKGDGGLEYYKRLNAIQTLVMIGLIGGPISLLFGGVLLSAAAIICAIIGYVRLRKIKASESPSGSIEKRLYVQSVFAIVICIVALALNTVSFMSMFQAMMEALNSGTLDEYMDSLFSGTLQNPSSQAGSSGSVWDR